MTPRQKQEFDRLRERNKFLEQWNNDQRAALRAAQRDASIRKCPRLGMNLARWLVDEIHSVTASGARHAVVKVSKSDLKAARTLLAWIERIDRASVSESERGG